jgi:hypothetical protein
VRGQGVPLRKIYLQARCFAERIRCAAAIFDRASAEIVHFFFAGRPGW